VEGARDAEAVRRVEDEGEKGALIPENGKVIPERGKETLLEIVYKTSEE